MPLRDHFSTADRIQWQGVHGGWPMMMVMQLNAKLDSRYVSSPNIHLGSHYEIDVGTVDVNFHDDFSSQHGGSGVSTLPLPASRVNAEHGLWDIYEVNITDIESGRLVSAIEIVSPANKDRPEAREAFTSKCAALLQQDISVSIIDICHPAHFNLYTELLSELRIHDPWMDGNVPSTYAVSMYDRDHPKKHKRRMFQSWPNSLEIGQPMPSIPLWLNEKEWVLLDLEESYEMTCKTLRIR